MMKRALLALMMCCAMSAVILPIRQVRAGSETIVTAAQVNGTWKNQNGTFKILALGKQRLQVSFSGIFRYKTPAGPSENEGEAEGIAFIEGDTATFKPEDAGNDCAITMKFAKDKLTVSQDGTCGFGFHVTAAGVYRKTGDRK
jgi:hypothetical protein